MQVHEIIAFLGAERPEGTAVILLDLAIDTHIREVCLNDLSGGQAFGLVEYIKRDVQSIGAGFGQQCARLIRVVVIGYAVT